MIHSIDPAACTGCGTCTKTCPLDVFRLEPAQEALSPCMAACPAGVDIRGNHYLIQQGHLGEAARRYRIVQPFPAITGRVCFHPCEEKCARNHVDEAVNINAVEQIMGDWDLKAPLERPARRHITKIAVIGSGPAGAARLPIRQTIRNMPKLRRQPLLKIRCRQRIRRRSRNPASGSRAKSSSSASVSGASRS